MGGRATTQATAAARGGPGTDPAPPGALRGRIRGSLFRQGHRCKDPGIQPWVPFPIHLALAAGSFFVPRMKAPHFVTHTHERVVVFFFPLLPLLRNRANETEKFPPGSQPKPREWEGALAPARLRVGADSQPLSQRATKRQQIALTHQ